MKLYTKESLINELEHISSKGWILNRRGHNNGAVGNTLEDLLGIAENNLPIPNAAEWELKTQRINSASLTTLFHCEPSPRALRFVPKILLPKYGWRHEEAGRKYSGNERSFRQTIHGCKTSDRGFAVKLDKDAKKVLVSFDSSKVDNRHARWLKNVCRNAGLGELNPQPYWGFSDLEHKAGTKLLNCFYVQAEVKKENGREYFHYCTAQMLRSFKFSGFLQAIKEGNVLVDFDARTGHNHGTKFRLRQNCLPFLYQEVIKIF
jgi:hypothetical protein